MHCTQLRATLALLAVAACGPGGSTTPQPPAGCTADPLGIGFDPSRTGEAIDDVFVPADPPPPPPPPIPPPTVSPCLGTWVVMQRLDLTGWGTAFPGGVDKRVGVCVAGGTWVGRLKPGIINPDGSCGRGPDSPDITVRFALEYGGDFDRVDRSQPVEACIYRSGITVSRFEVTGIAALDRAIEGRIRDTLHARLDRAAADRLNQQLPMQDVTSGQPLPADHSGRCDDWRAQDLPLPPP